MGGEDQPWKEGQEPHSVELPHQNGSSPKHLPNGESNIWDKWRVSWVATNFMLHLAHFYTRIYIKFLIVSGFFLGKRDVNGICGSDSDKGDSMEKSISQQHPLYGHGAVKYGKLYQSEWSLLTLYSKLAGVCKWPGCETVCDDFSSFLK